MRDSVVGIAVSFVAALAVGCMSSETTSPEREDDGSGVPGIEAARNGGTVEAVTDPALEAEIEARLTELARDLETEIRADRPEVAAPGFFWTGFLGAETMGGEVIFEDRGNKQLDVQWVPGDERRNDRTDLGYAIFPLFGAPAPGGLTPAQVEGAIDRAMVTWDDAACSRGLAITKGTLVDWLDFDSDILHAGFLDLGPGVLGVTLAFAFTDPVTGEFTDVDGDGNDDYAFAIIVYSSEFSWAIDGNIDVETVVLHEAGHGLAQAHFGKAFITLANERLHFSPRSVMNAAYSGVQQSLTGTDQAGHCSMYGSWPHG